MRLRPKRLRAASALIPSPAPICAQLAPACRSASTAETDTAHLFAGATGRDVSVVNDADAAGVAEMRFGAGKGRKGVVVLIADAFASSPSLDGFAGRVSDSGEGRWTVLAAVDEGVPAPVITTSLYERFESREAGEFTDKILSAMRSEFGGHAEKNG
ncbi:hypothetical protein [Streptomyces sp. NPDC005181]|uniref:hypothetical protein n=1 Tax=Streptomyces sp. NPDC005181 TaxID=3156869 RepID=UPI0033AF5E88